MALNLRDITESINLGDDSGLETNHLLYLILQELQIMNTYNSMSHDEVVLLEDIEDEHN